MAYVYRHIRLDKNEPFYIGIGSDSKYKRANELRGKRRNILWNRISLKTKVKVEIILDDLTWEDACKKEIEFIKLYGRLDKKTGILSNLTDGGDGSLGVIFSEDRKKLLRIRFSGVNNPMYGKRLPKEIIERISQLNKGRSVWNKGKKGIYSDETLKKMSDCKKGCIAWNKGMKNVNGKGMAKLVMDFNTGIFYESAKDASLAIGFNYTTLRSQLNGANKNKTSMMYV
jgi:hypothetical protein